MKSFKKIFNSIFTEKTSIIATFVLKMFCVESIIFFVLAYVGCSYDSSVMVSGNFEDGYTCCFLSLVFVYWLFRVPMIVKEFFNDIDAYRKENQDKSGE